MKKITKVVVTGLMGTALAVSSLGVAPSVYAEKASSKTEQTGEFKESKNIWVIGDSIASDHDVDEANEIQITGWGNVLQQFVPEDVTITNKARSGRSSKSYSIEQVYREVMKKLQPGDYVIIQFGHNDEKEAPRYTDPEGDSATDGSYKYYLKTKYIEPIYEKGGRVILASSVVRHLFEGDKLSEQTHGVYAEAMKELAEECKKEGKEIYFIDTFGITKDIYTRLGDEATSKFHAVLGKGDAAKLDDTHYGPYGAVYMANVIGQQLKELEIPCVSETKKAWIIEDDVEKIAEKRSSLEKFSWR